MNRISEKHKKELSKVLESVREVEKALESDCLLAALALCLTIPDALSAILYPKKNNTKAYAEWYNKMIYKYEKPSHELNRFNGYICYKLRCQILHGNTRSIDKYLIDEYNTSKIKFNLTSNDTSYGKTWNTDESSAEFNINISVPYLCKNICAVAKRFCEINNVVRNQELDTIQN